MSNADADDYEEFGESREPTFHGEVPLALAARAPHVVSALTWLVAGEQVGEGMPDWATVEAQA